MTVPFNAGEIFEIARQIERNGARFYRQAAVLGDGQDRQALLDLAEMEDRHERTFAAMATELSPAERQGPLYDPYGEAVQYLRAVAGGYVFDLRADPAEWLRGDRSEADVLRKAIGLEKDSIVFYLGVKRVVPEKLGKDRIDAIIGEEMSHVTLLSNRLAAIES